MFHFYSARVTKCFPFFPSKTEEIFQCRNKCLFILDWYQITGFPCIHGLTTAAAVCCNNGSSACRCFQQNIAHALWVIRRVNNTVRHLKIGTHIFLFSMVLQITGIFCLFDPFIILRIITAATNMEHYIRVILRDTFCGRKI